MKVAPLNRRDVISPEEDTFFTGKDLKSGNAPEGIYRYASDRAAVTHFRHILVGKTTRQQLLCFDSRSSQLLPGHPNDTTMFEKVNERLHLAFVKESRKNA